MRLWIILDEFNSNIVGRSFYLEPEPPIGRFSKAFFFPVLREFIARRKSFTEISRRREVVRYRFSYLSDDVVAIDAG